MNIPLDEYHPERFEAAIQGKIEELQKPLYVLCRRGNNSQLAVSLLGEKFKFKAVDLIDGMQGWTEYDSSCPLL